MRKLCSLMTCNMLIGDIFPQWILTERTKRVRQQPQFTDRLCFFSLFSSLFVDILWSRFVFCWYFEALVPFTWTCNSYTLRCNLIPGHQQKIVNKVRWSSSLKKQGCKNWTALLSGWWVETPTLRGKKHSHTLSFHTKHACFSLRQRAMSNKGSTVFINKEVNPVVPVYISTWWGISNCIIRSQLQGALYF